MPAGYYRYVIHGFRVTVWREGEGPDTGSWFYSYMAGFSDASEPFATKRAAKQAAIAGLGY